MQFLDFDKIANNGENFWIKFSKFENFYFSTKSLLKTGNLKN